MLIILCNLLFPLQSNKTGRYSSKWLSQDMWLNDIAVNKTAFVATKAPEKRISHLRLVTRSACM